jgi:hypothetical protein
MFIPHTMLVSWRTTAVTLPRVNWQHLSIPSTILKPERKQVIVLKALALSIHHHPRISLTWNNAKRAANIKSPKPLAIADTAGMKPSDKEQYLDLVASVIQACPNLERLIGLYPAYMHEFYY